MDFSAHPINRIEWVDVNLLDSNDYNPNYVMQQELALLAFSIKKQGWIQPILVWPDGTGRYTIIDGYHRHLVTKTFREIWDMTDGKVPVVQMSMSVPDRMLLTIRINRAKGNHAAIKMHKIVYSLVKEHGMDPARVAQEIGADRPEIDILMAQNVFEAKQVDNYQYTKSWYPPGVKEHGMEETAS